MVTISSGAEVVGAEGKMEDTLREDIKEDTDGTDTIMLGDDEEEEDVTEVCCEDVTTSSLTSGMTTSLRLMDSDTSSSLNRDSADNVGDTVFITLLSLILAASVSDSFKTLELFKPESLMSLILGLLV